MSQIERICVHDQNFLIWVHEIKFHESANSWNAWSFLNAPRIKPFQGLLDQFYQDLKHFKSITVYRPNIVKLFPNFNQQKYILYITVLVTWCCPHNQFTVFDMGMSTKEQRNPKIIWKWWMSVSKPMDLEGQFGLTQPHHTAQLPRYKMTKSNSLPWHASTVSTLMGWIFGDPNGFKWGPVPEAGVGNNSYDIWALK